MGKLLRLVPTKLSLTILWPTVHLQKQTNCLISQAGGVTTDGQLKPDVTAPGGNIFSSLNDNTYGDMSGTSMASPHVAGVAALVKEYLVKHHPELTPEQVSATVKALIMSTAKPHVNKETGVYTSPRQQGAGVVDTAAAVSTDLYVTGENNYQASLLEMLEIALPLMSQSTIFQIPIVP